MRALRYAIEEAALPLWRGKQAVLLSTATFALALFVLGGFVVVNDNLQRLGAECAELLAPDECGDEVPSPIALLQERRPIAEPPIVRVALEDDAIGSFDERPVVDLLHGCYFRRSTCGCHIGSMSARRGTARDLMTRISRSASTASSRASRRVARSRAVSPSADDV